MLPDGATVAVPPPGGTSAVGASEVSDGGGAGVDVGLDVAVGFEVAVELPPQAANKKAAVIETIPNIQVRFLVTE